MSFEEWEGERRKGSGQRERDIHRRICYWAIGLRLRMRFLSRGERERDTVPE